ncbi:MAG: tRNA uridine-5-carboxymethylaminomethyl(34) synthesis GTPase MnmE, partial [Rikenellaceae bacterium]
FRAPHSYSGEDMVEISVHGSDYILAALLANILSKGGRMASPGEFTMRAYCNGKMDLVQAEAVADMIASSTAASHRLAVNQMRGGYSGEFVSLRSQLLTVMSLIELELDFGEEDVEFADRGKLMDLLHEINGKITFLVSSFSRGNAIKNGVPVAIVGRPNAGKSTLLNALLRDDRAIVSDIAGTTRDVIEERMILSGVEYRFIDTAGIRVTDDRLESMGIERTMRAIDGADIILLVLDGRDDLISLKNQVLTVDVKPHQKLLLVLNKSDLCDLDDKKSELCGL